MYIFCEVCHVKKETFYDWMDHLLDTNHQNITKTIPWTKLMNDRSIVVQNVSKEVTADDVAWHFASQGFLADFCCYTINDTRTFVVQFDNRNTAAECIDNVSKIGDASPKLQWKDSSIDSFSLANEGFDFRSRHLQLNQNLTNMPINQQLSKFIDATTLSPKDVDDRHNLMLELTGLIKFKYRNCVLYPFGSTFTRLGDVDSDIDVCVDAEDTFGRDISYVPHLDEKMSAFNRVLSILRRKCEGDVQRDSSNEIFSSVFHIRHARVPIIKTVHKKTGIKCDFSFESLISVRNSEMIAFYASLDSRVRPLILLVRYWARYHDLTGCVQIKNYTLILLVLTFLQKKRIVPTVHFLQTLPENETLLIDGWDASFLGDSAKVMSAFSAKREKIPTGNDDSGRSIFNLAYEFFDLYANIDFETHAACPLLGKFLSKKSLEDFKLIPNEMKRYKNWFEDNMHRRDKKDLLRLDSPLCVVDPFNLAFNVGSCASEFITYKFQKACKESSDRLRAMLSNPDFENGACVTDICFPVLTSDFNRNRR